MTVFRIPTLNSRIGRRGCGRDPPLSVWDGPPDAYPEVLARASFHLNPVRKRGARGWRAQQLLLGGGTLDGNLYVAWEKRHGIWLLGLYSTQDIEGNRDVTCYGGVRRPKPAQELDTDTHMRCVPGEDFVMDGKEFAACFQGPRSPLCEFGGLIPVLPRCGSRGWREVIRSSGIGYMANTVTKCPRVLERPNVFTAYVPLGRTIPGVPYTSLMVLRAGVHGIRAGEPIVSVYVWACQKAKFTFACKDRGCYAASSKPYPDFW